jgi:hypothetical protein
MGYDDLTFSNRAKLLARKDEWARRDIEDAYDDCLLAVFKIRTDDFTKLASGKKIAENDAQSVGDWLIAMADDIEREILRRKAARLAKGKSDDR